MSHAIVFEKVVKQYGERKVIPNLDLEIPKGNIVVFVGPSGCGKTTTMKMINRLIEPTAGKIFVQGKDVLAMDPVELRREIGYVIQQVGLFPHMTIAENVSLVLRLKKQKVNISEIGRMLELVGLDPRIYGNRYPRQLSGGQQQRVGVARALMSDPEIILMDEPFSALDPVTREQLQEELIRLNESLNKTIVFVTHDMDEALKIADRIVVMQNGEIVQQGTPENILRYPVNEFVREFIGEKRLATHISLKVEDVMLTNPVTILPHKGLAEAVQLMQRKHVTGLLVTDKNGRYLGIVNSETIYEKYQRDFLCVKDVMDTEFTKIKLGTPLVQAIPIVQKTSYGYVPVIDPQGNLVGLLTRASLVDVLAKPYLGEEVVS